MSEPEMAHRRGLVRQSIQRKILMPRTITVGAAQLGPIARNESRGQVVKRLLGLMREAHHFRCDLVAFPELALTTFFPRWALEDEAELDSFYETEMPGPAT